MRIDRVLEAHGIGIVVLHPPTSPTNGIVTNGLVSYWNSRQGVSGTAWANIAPSTIGQYPAYLYQSTVTSEGVSFNGSTSYVQIPIPADLKSITSATFEMKMKFNGGWADLINQDGRELIWISDNRLELSGIFDANKSKDHKSVNTTIKNVELFLTITANLSTNTITAQLHNPVTGTTASGSYTTTIGTFANGDYVWISRSQTPFSGYIDSIRLYNRALTQEEIERNWSAGSAVGL